MKKYLILLLLFLYISAYSQKHCDCDLSKIEDWNEKDKGENDKLSQNGKLFQHPVSTFISRLTSLRCQTTSKLSDYLSLAY